jgi:hypothetical protein
MARFQRNHLDGSASSKLEEARLQLDMLDASIRAHQLAGEEDTVARLLRVRRRVAARAARLATDAVRPPPRVR